MIQDLHHVIQLIESDWRTMRLLVVGDIMLDRYIWGEVERISPEAPVPIVRAVHRNERPGGAANVAMNIAGLGATAMLFGFCGDDAENVLLEKCLREANVLAEMTRVASHPTTTKLRILSGQQQMLRLDTEQVAGYPAEAYAAMIAAFEAALSNANAVVLSDYAKGVLTEEVCRRLIGAANAREFRCSSIRSTAISSAIAGPPRSARTWTSWRRQRESRRKNWMLFFRPDRRWFRNSPFGG